MSEPQIDWEQLDFEAPVPTEFEGLDDVYGELDDTLQVFIGECNEYAAKQSMEGREVLEIGVGTVTQRLQESFEKIFSDLDQPAAALTSHSMIVRVNRQWTDTYNKLLGEDRIAYWPPSSVQEMTERHMAEYETIEDLAEALATECGLTFQSDLNQFAYCLENIDADSKFDFAIRIGRNAIRQLFNLEDGSQQYFLGYPFRIEPGLAVHDPEYFEPADVQFGISDDSGTEGKFWVPATFLRHVRQKTAREERIRKHIAQTFLIHLDPFGDKNIQIIYSDNEPSKVPESENET